MRLELLTEFGCGNNKSLLITLPNEYIKDLQVDSEGVVDTLSLLKILTKLNEAQDKRLSIEERINLMNVIFNTERAVAERPVDRRF